MIAPTPSTSRFPADIVPQMDPVIRRIARKLMRRLPGHICVEDLVAAGFVGLVMAHRRFDPARGESFRVFAEHRIRGAMLDELRALDPLSREQRAKTKRIAAASRALHGRLGRPPEDRELAGELQIPLHDYWDHVSTVRACALASLDFVEEGEAPVQVSDTDAAPADEILSEEQDRRAVHEAIESLPPRLRKVVELRYREGWTLREIGAHFCVTEARASQLDAEAVRRIREQCKGRPLHADCACASRMSPPRASRPRDARQATFSA